MIWNFKEASPQKVNELSAALAIDKHLATLLVQRGIDTFDKAKSYFRPSLSELHDPMLMKDMDKAVTRILQAIEHEENILVFGDYDVDGTTAVSLLYSFLHSVYPNVTTYIPDRYDEGYGISFKGIDYAEDNNISLIIALDCGIKAQDKIDYAKTKNIDFIIGDHHLPGATIPDAVAVLDPKRSDCPYPYKELCGCGIAFKITQALAPYFNLDFDALIPYLDLAATAIAADIVPITGENRILAKFGLEVINTSPRNGILALKETAKNQQFTITDVVFTIAPRINAAGRIKHGNYAVQLLTEFDYQQAKQVAKEIEEFNTSRKNLDSSITKEALHQIQEKGTENLYTTVVHHPSWHKGVIGIVASRLIETYYKPTLVFTHSGDKMVASARSVKNFDIHHALEQCSEYIEQFGGHKYAAGLTVAKDKFELFRQKFEQVVSNSITQESQTPEVLIDLELNFCDITPKFIRILKQFEPFGPENMTPIFYARNVFDTGQARTLGKDGEHLKLFIKQDNSNGIPAIGFKLGHLMDSIKNRQRFSIAYSIEENHWNGQTTLQLNIRDIRLQNE